MKYKTGDKIIITESCPYNFTVKIGDICEIEYHYSERFGKGYENTEWYSLTAKDEIKNGIESYYFELFEEKKEMSQLNPGMLFKKQDNIYLVADSSNQRWIVNIVTGKAKWLAKEGTVAEIEAKGYKYLMTTKEMLSGGVLNAEAPKALTGKVEEPIENAPKEYNPFSSFDLLFKNKLVFKHD